MNKVLKSIKVDYEVADDITWQTKNTDFNFSAWVEAKYIEEFMADKKLRNRITELQKELENAKKRWTRFIKQTKKTGHALKRNWTNEKEEELKLSRKLIKKNPNLLKGRVRYWNNKFKENLSMTTFKLMLENEE